MREAPSGVAVLSIHAPTDRIRAPARQVEAAHVLVARDVYDADVPGADLPVGCLEKHKAHPLSHLIKFQKLKTFICTRMKQPIRSSRRSEEELYATPKCFASLNTHIGLEPRYSRRIAQWLVRCRTGFRFDATAPRTSLATSR